MSPAQVAFAAQWRAEHPDASILPAYPDDASLAAYLRAMGMDANGDWARAVA